MVEDRASSAVRPGQNVGGNVARAQDRAHSQYASSFQAYFDSVRCVVKASKRGLQKKDGKINVKEHFNIYIYVFALKKNWKKTELLLLQLLKFY